VRGKSLGGAVARLNDDLHITRKFHPLALRAVVESTRWTVATVSALSGGSIATRTGRSISARRRTISARAALATEIAARRRSFAARSALAAVTTAGTRTALLTLFILRQVAAAAHAGDPGWHHAQIGEVHLSGRNRRFGSRFGFGHVVRGSCIMAYFCAVANFVRAPPLICAFLPAAAVHTAHPTPIAMIHPLRLFAAFAALTLSAAAADNAYLGRWALDLPGGRAGWLGVEEKEGKLSASVLWGGGSVVPTQGAELKDGKLLVTRLSQAKRKNKAGAEISETITETLTVQANGNTLAGSTVKTRPEGKPFGQGDFTGKRIPALPPRPELAKVKFGEPVSLFNGRDLSGWRLIKADDHNGWKVEDGVLMNRVLKEPGKHFGNLRTDAEFEDFNLKLEARTQEGSNSGVYLRGIYEVQIMESYGKPLDSHHMGALYSRITPTVAAEKPIGEWQTLDITLVDRHLTVILNGATIIDNQPVLGCTGGALTSDEFKPGPIFLQGDHTNVDYRNMVLRPVLK
jgi:hypothetical protein